MARRLAPGVSMVDDDGVVHVVRWSDVDAYDFTIICTARLFFINTPFFQPTEEKPSCLQCLAEIER